MNYFPALAAAVFLLVTAVVRADIVIVNGDSAGEGLNDTTPATAVGGNSGTTVGEQRLNVFSEAAGILNATFSISQTIAVNAQFNSLSCNASSGVLGSAGPTYSYSAVEDGVGTVYPIGLANEHFATDLIPAAEEIQATFNADLGTTGCLENTPWYYGYDAPPGTESSLLSVVLHELMHGMGFLSMLGEDGSAPGVHPDDGITEIYDPYSKLLYDASQAQRLTGLSQTERAAALLNDGNLLWDGAQTNTNLSGLSAGVNGSRVQMYAPTVYESGSSVSHFDSAATPNEIMEPVYTEFLPQAGLARYVLGDIGWTLATSGNNAPQWDILPPVSLLTGSSATVTLSASDPDDDSLTFTVLSSSSGLSASLSGDQLTISAAESATDSGSVAVRVSDGVLTADSSVSVTVYPAFSLTQDSTANSDGAVLSAGLNDVLFSLSGGDSALSVSVFYNGSNRDDLLSYDSSSGDYTLALPASGAFAGTYTLTVTDSQGFSASWYLERPLALTAGVTPLLLLSGSQQPLTITGAPAATSIALSSSDTGLSFATTDGSATTLVTATDDATAFNPASVLLVTDAALTTALSATVTASASNIPDSSAALIFALPRSVLFTVNDSDGNPITAADISSDDGRFSLWNLPASATSSSDGSVSMQLPDEEITLSVSADGYRTGSVTVSAGDSDASVTLISADSAYTLYGIVSASGFTFMDENPQLTLWFSDDSSETLSVTSITASTVRYRWQGDLTVATPVYLALSHSQAETAEISLDTSLSEQRLNVTLELITDSTATESSGTVTSSSSTGGGAGALLWFILGLLLLWPRPARGQLNSSQ